MKICQFSNVQRQVGLILASMMFRVCKHVCLDATMYVCIHHQCICLCMTYTYYMYMYASMKSQVYLCVSVYLYACIKALIRYPLGCHSQFKEKLDRV